MKSNFNLIHEQVIKETKTGVIEEGCWNSIANNIGSGLKKFSNNFRSDKGKKQILVKTFNQFLKNNGFSQNADEKLNPTGSKTFFWKKSENDEHSILIYRSPRFLEDPKANKMIVYIYMDNDKSSKVPVEIPAYYTVDKIKEEIMDALEAISMDAVEIFKLDSNNSQNKNEQPEQPEQTDKKNDKSDKKIDNQNSQKKNINKKSGEFKEADQKNINVNEIVKCPKCHEKFKKYAKSHGKVYQRRTCPKCHQKIN